MSLIKTCFDRLAREHRKALITFITAGDPNPEVTVPLLHGLVAAGADVLELGIPFSDPMAEGPVIQAACERALAHGMTLHKVLEQAAEFRKQDQTTPLILMGYLNPIETTGYDQFAKAAVKSGVDGVILVDLPFEEAEEMMAIFKAQDIDLIWLVAPTTPPARIAKISPFASGFSYCVSRRGVTGESQLDVNAIAEQVDAIRESIRLPIAVGFGINDAASAQAVSNVADGVVVGSAIVKRLVDSHDPEVAGQEAFMLVREMRAGMDRGVEAKLLEDWNLCVQNQLPKKISPLE